MSLPDDTWCLLVGSHSVFPVNVNEARIQTVAHLKEAIKVKIDYSAPAYDLTLYRVAIDKSYDKKKRINELERFSQNLKEDMKLDETQQLSTIFGEMIPPENMYCILVQTPESEPH
jgi:hypothetical protein